MIHSLKPDIAVSTIETLRNRVYTIGMLRAVKTAASQQAGEVGDTDTEYLLGQNMVDAILEVRYLICQALRKPTGDLTQEDSRLGTWIEKLGRLIGPKICAAVICRPRFGQGIKHPVSEFRRGEDFIIGEIGDTRQDIRVSTAERKGCL